MIETEVLIVGGGPAGSACAWKLRQKGVDCLLLDKAVFPRVKACAGWITPQVLRDLDMDPADYPHSFTRFNRFQVSLKEVRFQLPTRQYAIRRVEFDHWLLQRSGCACVNHAAKAIAVEDGRYLIDGEFSARYLVGAGGTHCPVRRTFFPDSPQGSQGSLIVAQEEEFLYDYTDERCSLWFFQHGLPGYAWYVPKANGFVNVGVGGSAAMLKAQDDTLKRHWNLLVKKLEDLGLVRGHEYRPIGHSYYLRGKRPLVRKGNAFLAGDAAGLASLDMGEGIGPAIQSGIRAAEAILSGRAYSVDSVHRYSIPSLVGMR